MALTFYFTAFHVFCTIQLDSCWQISLCRQIDFQQLISQHTSHFRRVAAATCAFLLDAVCVWVCALDFSQLWLVKWFLEGLSSDHFILAPNNSQVTWCPGWSSLIWSVHLPKPSFTGANHSNQAPPPPATLPPPIPAPAPAQPLRARGGYRAVWSKLSSQSEILCHRKFPLSMHTLTLVQLCKGVMTVRTDGLWIGESLPQSCTPGTLETGHLAKVSHLKKARGQKWAWLPDYI